MNNFSPLVSIVIPVYNGANYLREAIDSALAQTYKNIEILVINDGSKDNGATESIALSYGNKIRYFHKPNGGVASALNAGIRKMKGEYFSWLSHDDVYYPDKVEFQIKFLAGKKDKNIVLYSDYEFIDKDSKYIKDASIQNISPENFIYNLITSYPIHGCTILVPKVAFEKVGIFDEQLRTTQDYDLWFRMAQRYNFVFIDKMLIRSRMHEEQGTVNLSDLCIQEINNLLINFVEKLSTREINKIKKESNMPLFYLNLSRNFNKRGFSKAANFARRKFYKSVFSAVLFTNPRLLLTFAKTISKQGITAFILYSSIQY